MRLGFVTHTFCFVSSTTSDLHDLPREAVVRTTPRSARSIVRILRSDPADLLFLLPLEFQLAFFRVLIRTVADESDREYDAECLFDFSDGGDSGDGVLYDDVDGGFDACACISCSGGQRRWR